MTFQMRYPEMSPHPQVMHLNFALSAHIFSQASIVL